MRTDFRLIAPVACAVFGAALYIISPLSHQAFCAPVKVIVPDGSAIVPIGGE